MTIKNSNKYTAIDLLDKLIEFTNMTLDSSEWNFKMQHNNTLRLVRLQQIQVLVEAEIMFDATN